jgi:hypothetical protein
VIGRGNRPVRQAADDGRPEIEGRPLQGKWRGVRYALIEARTIRQRPIIMATLAMVLGMIPLVLGIGEGSAQRAPISQAGRRTSTASGAWKPLCHHCVTLPNEKFLSPTRYLWWPFTKWLWWPA